MGQISLVVHILTSPGAFLGWSVDVACVVACRTGLGYDSEESLLLHVEAYELEEGRAAIPTGRLSPEQDLRGVMTGELLQSSVGGCGVGAAEGVTVSRASAETPRTPVKPPPALLQYESLSKVQREFCTAHSPATARSRLLPRAQTSS